MAIPRAAYGELKEAVGLENLSEDPAVLDSYACHATWAGIPAQAYGNIWWRRADAVVLPGSTEEVQEVVRVCNRYGIKFKAHSTGQMPFAFPLGKDSITLDLRRMNRIIEINEEHMYALVEPYVTQGELLVECIKRGLVPHMIDAGPSISPLASVTSVHGEGDSSITRSYNERNGMALEWVLPDGELVRIGSPDTPGAGWFSADGPGPSLFGLIRGAIGHGGESGVFTAAAIKLYPWYGPREFETGGTAPWFDMKKWPLCRVLSAKWDDYAAEAEALYLIAQAEFFDTLGKLSTTKLEAIVAEDKNDYARIRRSGAIAHFIPHGLWGGVVVARTQKQLDYAERAFRKIVEETGGTCFEDREVPMPPGMPCSREEWAWRVENVLLQVLLMKTFTPKACEMPMAGTTGPLPYVSSTTIDKTYEFLQKVSFPFKERFQKEGKLVDDGPDGTWCTLEEGGHWMRQMNFSRMEQKDPGMAFIGLAETSAIESYQQGFALLDFLHSFEKMAEAIPYVTELHDLLDPDGLTTGFIINSNKIFFGEDY